MVLVTHRSYDPLTYVFPYPMAQIDGILEETYLWFHLGNVDAKAYHC